MVAVICWPEENSTKLPPEIAMHARNTKNKNKYVILSLYGLFLKGAAPNTFKKIESY
jgi:hypothetical protein